MTILEDLKRVVEEHSEYLYTVRGETVEQLLTANTMLMASRIKTSWTKDVTSLSEQLWRQTRCNVPAVVFRNLINACYQSGYYNAITYADLLRVFKVKVVYDEELQN